MSAPAIPALHEAMEAEVNRLMAKLSNPPKVSEIAAIMGWSERTVYESMGSYDQHMHNGNEDAALRYIPCVRSGGTRDKEGRGLHGRLAVNRMTFVWWYVTGGHRYARPGEGEAA